MIIPETRKNTKTCVFGDGNSKEALIIILNYDNYWDVQHAHLCWFFKPILAYVVTDFEMSMSRDNVVE